MHFVRAQLYTLLRKSEKFFRTDMLYLAKNGSWVWFNQIGLLITGGIFALVVARIAPETVFGTYKYILSVAALLQAVSLTGIFTTVTRSVARGYEALVYTGFWYNLRWSAGLVLLGLGTASYYFFAGNATLGWSLIVVSLCAPFMLSARVAGAFLVGRKKFRTNTIITILHNILATLVMIGTFWFTHNVIILIAVYFLTHTLIGLAIYLMTRYRFTPNHKHEPGALRYGMHLSVMNLFSTLALQLDTILIFQHIGAAEVALYSFAILLPEHLRRSVKIIPTLAFPQFTQRRFNDTRAQLWRKIALLAGVLVVVVGVYILLAPTIYAWLFPRYTDAVPLSQIVALGVIVAGGLPATFLSAHKAVKEQYMLTIVGNTARIVLMVAGFFGWGLWGLIIGRVISRYVSFVVSLVIVAYARPPREETEATSGFTTPKSVA